MLNDRKMHVIDLLNDKKWITGKAAYTKGIVCSIFNLVTTIFIIYPLGTLLLS